MPYHTTSPRVSPLMYWYPPKLTCWYWASCKVISGSKLLCYLCCPVCVSEPVVSAILVPPFPPSHLSTLSVLLQSQPELPPLLVLLLCVLLHVETVFMVIGSNDHEYRTVVDYSCPPFGLMIIRRGSTVLLLLLLRLCH